MIKKNLHSTFSILLLYLHLGAFFSLKSQEKVPYEKNPNRVSFVEYSFPSSAPREWNDYKMLPEPKLDDLRLRFPKKFPSAYVGPDGGEVYLWKPGLYKWTRVDGSVFQEWENGSWKFQIPDHITIESFRASCNGCGATYRYTWSDGTEINKTWVPHRKEYAVSFQNEKTTPALNWLIPDPDKFSKNRISIGPYEFYYSDNWNFYLHGLRESFNANAYLQDVEREYGLSNKGRIPVLLFDKSSDFVAYNGRNLPGVSSEGGFGGQDSIVLCCGNTLKQSTGNAVVDLDTQMRTYFGTFYHEATHNLHQIECLSKRSGKAGLPLQNHDDPWFVEGFANHVASTFFPQKRAEIYEQLAKKITTGKIPRDFDQMIKAEYSDLLPYSLGAYLVEYMHREYGKEAIQNYIHLSCVGKPTREVVKEVTGKEASRFYSDAVADFQVIYPKSKKQINLWKFGHLTKINPVNPKEFERFQKTRIKLPSSVLQVKSITEVPDLKQIFEADISSYAGEVEGDFFGLNGERFYLWKQGNYKWYDDDYELFFNPENSIILRYKSWEIINWSNGQKKIVAPDGTSAVFWNEEQKAYYAKDGSPL
ncbi:hypothetical protein EHQ58_11710 [Leptospira ognonensis]|uniref:Peptidase MA family protein n=1 Tax=Leptospira ognonensis TaxID=2484945 RepID=A0A4R9JXV5_9LEPT|nr:hypothetical protein [Leptospira ognonensis]TGL58051.1 hypothetical protein EHQ58_11710 [Leptospira ognonensis]